MLTATETEPIVETIADRRKRAARELAEARKELKRSAKLPNKLEVPEGPTLREMLDDTLWEFLKRIDDLRQDRDRVIGRPSPRVQAESAAQSKRHQAEQVLRSTAPQHLRDEIESLTNRRAMLGRRVLRWQPLLARAHQFEELEAALPEWKKGNVSEFDWQRFCRATHRPWQPIREAINTKMAGNSLPHGATNLRLAAIEKAQRHRKKMLEILITWGESETAKLRAQAGRVVEARDQTSKAQDEISEINQLLSKLDAEMLKA